MPNINTVLQDHVALKCECIDRMFLNGYVAMIQSPGRLGYFLSQYRGEDLPRYEILGKMTRDFVAAVEALASAKGIPVVHFERGQSKEEIAAPYFAAAKHEGVVLIGVAQEKANVYRPPAKSNRGNGQFGATRNSAFVNHFYFYIWDDDFGPSFIKFCTYAPFQVRVWLNGHQWAKRQLQRKGIGFTALDNGIAAVEDPIALQHICSNLSAAHVQRYFDRWIYRLPNPFSSKDRRAGYFHQLSILQFEVSRTEVFDRPLHGRQFFEEVIHDHIDLGRPDKLQIIFGKAIPRRKDGGPWRTRIFCEGVEVSLQASHRGTGIKQYLKHGRALRTETTFHDTYEFGIGRSIKNLVALRDIGLAINDRLIELERASHHCTPAASEFENLVMPTGPIGHRAPGLRLGDPRVAALYNAVGRFCWQLNGFRARDLQPFVESHLAQPYSMRQMAYDLRRLARKGIIERIPKSHRYQLTTQGRQLVPLCVKVHARVLCHGISDLHPDQVPNQLRRAWTTLDRQFDTLITDARLAA